jgi:hypothetical protein
LRSQCMKDMAETGSYFAVEFFLSHLGNEDEMILTVPLGMGQAVVRL